jgi:hypothetical protein
MIKSPSVELLRVRNAWSPGTVLFLSVVVKTEGVAVKIHCLISTNTFSYPFPLLPTFTAGVEVVYFHFIALRHTPQSVGLLWTRDRSVAETST